MPDIRRGPVTIGAATDLGGVRELAEIVEQGNSLRIGSGVSLVLAKRLTQRLWQAAARHWSGSRRIVRR